MNTQDKQYGDSLRFRLLKWLQPLIMTAVMLIFWVHVYIPAYRLSISGLEQAMVAFVYLFLLYQLNKIYHALTVGLVRVSELIYSQALALLFCNVMAYLACCLYCREFIETLPLFAMMVIQFELSMLWSLLANRWYFRNYAVPKTALFYRDDEDLRRIYSVKYFEDRFDVAVLIREPGTDLSCHLSKLEGIQAIFSSGIDHGLKNQIALYCLKNGLCAYFTPTIEEVIVMGAEYMPIFSEPVMKIQRAHQKTGYLTAKRAMDIVVSLIGLVVLSPLMLVVAAAIKLHDGGPVFYKQKRLTLGGKVFPILKFRSMRTDAEKDGVARLACEDDHRITPIGSIIRSMRIDELPQLINILFGDMSLVGPRPERPEIAAEYEEALPEFALRLQVRAGLTGMAQVYGRYNTDPNNKLKMDLLYINRLSFLTDFRLMLATAKILFLKESTAGIREGQKTAAENTSQLSKKSA